MSHRLLNPSDSIKFWLYIFKKQNYYELDFTVIASNIHIVLFWIHKNRNSLVSFPTKVTQIHRLSDFISAIFKKYLLS